MKYSYDEKCLDLARHFFPNQSIAFLEALAQEFQDCVEGREDTDDKTLPIPDFLRNQDNLRAERASQEPSPARETVGEFVQRVREQASVPRFTGPYGGDCTICGHTYDSHGDNLLECPTANRGESHER